MICIGFQDDLMSSVLMKSRFRWPALRRKSPKWEERAILNLAKAALQNGCDVSDKETFRRIADRARLLAHVPENHWSDVEWFEEE